MVKHCTEGQCAVGPDNTPDNGTPSDTNTVVGGAPGVPQRREWHIKSDPAHLRQVRVELEEFASLCGAGKDAQNALGLCANEALANVIRHGYHGRHDKPIEMIAEHIHGEIQVKIRDWAPPIDPSKLPTEPKDILKPGGLGLLCMRKMMDEIHFSPLPDGNFLTMIKKIEKK
jgi:sigma-B regulation protein RsbU (phosphoserine phosphatase)